MWNIIFHILVMESSFFMSDFSDFLKKIRIHKYFNILDDFSKYFWRFFRIIKSFWNTIKLNDFYKIKQFGGFFKIFGEILRLQMPGNLWRRALTVFTQMNKKTRNGQKWGVVTLTLFNNSKIWIIIEYFPKIGFLGTQWGGAKVLTIYQWFFLF